MENIQVSERIVRMPELIQLVGYKSSSIYALIQNKKFPPGFKLVDGGRAAGWLFSEVMSWIRGEWKGD